jgi:predicted amidohydrolase
VVDNFVIAVAQTDPLKGNAEANLQDHARFIRAAAKNCANIVIFPELSLTGYEPNLAEGLAMSIGDKRLYSLREPSS